MRTMRTKLPLRTFLVKSYVTGFEKDERSKKIVELHDKKLTQHEIAEILNVSQATVSKALTAVRYG